VYSPALVRSAVVTFEDTRRGIRGSSTVTLVNTMDAAGNKVHWDRTVDVAPHGDTSSLATEPHSDATFAELPAAALKSSTWAAIRKDFADWVFANHREKVFHSSLLDLWSNPGEPVDVFRARIAQTARELRDKALEELREKTAKRARALEDRAARSEVNLQTQRSQSRSSALASALDIGGGLIGAVLGRKGGIAAVLKGTNVNKAGRVHREAAQAAAAESELKRVRNDIAQLEADTAAAMEELRSKYDTSSMELETVTLVPLKKNIQVAATGVLWIPEEVRS
jgi:hypothetical protein